MPGILPRYEVNDKTLNELTADEFRKRQDAIKLYWRYYGGDHHKPLRPDTNGHDDNILINLCGRSVEKMVEFIGIPKQLELPGEQDAPKPAPAPAVNPNGQPDMAALMQPQPVPEAPKESPQQIALDELFDAFRADVPQLFVSGMVAGHVFLKINQDDDESWRLDLLDAQHILAFWDITNVRRKLFYRMEWMMGDDKRRVDIVPDWLLEQNPVPRAPQSWAIIEYEMKGMSSRWVELTRDAWAYEFPPIIDWANKRQPHHYYGVSNLRNAVPLNDAVNFIASNTGRIIKYHAHPRTIAKGVAAEDIEMTSVDGFFTIPNPEAEVTNLEMQSDLASSMNFFGQLKGEFFADQRMVDLSTIRDKLGQVTNFGVRMIFNEQLENADEKRRIYGDGLTLAFQRLAIVNGTEVEKPEARWDDPLPANRAEAVKTAQGEIALGVSHQTVFEDLGRDYFKEQELKQAEGGAQMDNTVRLLEQFGNTGGAANLFGNNVNRQAERESRRVPA